MTANTKLEPVTRARALELLGMLNTARQDETKAIALDDEGFATRVVPVDDPRQKHLLGDLDVHA